MKTKLFSILAIGAIAITSCKKEEEAETMMGTATINGTIRADIDQTNDVNNAGLYDEYSMPDAVEGMIVRVEVDTKKWDESPVAGFDYAVKTYTTTTDAEGKFSLEIPATTNGYTVNIEFENVNGVSRKMYTTDGSELTEASYVSKNTEFNVAVYAGANLNKVYNADIFDESAEAKEYGMATVRGRVFADWIRNDNSGIFAPYEWGTGFPFEGQTLSWGYYSAPYGIGNSDLFTTTVDAEGRFSFQVPTYVFSEMNDVDGYFGIADFVAEQIIDNNAGTADSSAASVYSLGGIEAEYFNVEDGDVIDINLFYDSYNEINNL